MLFRFAKQFFQKSMEIPAESAQGPATVGAAALLWKNSHDKATEIKKSTENRLADHRPSC
jgi:hypothetical protein